MSDPSFFVSTPRLYISYLIPSNDAHCDFLVKLYNSPAFIASIGGQPTSITTREAARAVLAGRFQAEHARNGYGIYLMSLKPASASTEADDRNPLAAATPLGTVSLMKGEEPNCYSAPDLGFAVLPEFMRQGYAKEASEGLLRYAEEQLGVIDVLGMHNPANEGSGAVFRSLGFEDRGLRELKMFGGEIGRVWTKKGMSDDLSVYGLPKDAPPSS
jgi:RimJ/RimL family protein N-acetyltransferase